jgi:hypothetical protein
MEVAVERHGEQTIRGKGDVNIMKKIILSAVAAFAFSLTSAAYAQSTPSNDKAPPSPPPPSTATDSSGPSTATATAGTEAGTAGSAKKTDKNKRGSEAPPGKTEAPKY